MNKPLVYLPDTANAPTINELRHLTANSKARRLNVRGALKQGPQGLLDALYMATLPDILGVHPGDPVSVVNRSYDNRVAHARASCTGFRSEDERKALEEVLKVLTKARDILLDADALARYIRASAAEGGLLSYQNHVLFGVMNAAPETVQPAARIRPRRQSNAKRAKGKNALSVALTGGVLTSVFVSLIAAMV